MGPGKTSGKHCLQVTCIWERGQWKEEEERTRRWVIDVVDKNCTIFIHYWTWTGFCSVLLFSLFQALWCLRLKGKKNDTKVAQYILCQICLHMETTIWVCSLLLQLSYLLLRFCHTVLKANCCSEHLASVPVSSSLTLHCVKMISYFLHDSAWRERRL